MTTAKNNYRIAFLARRYALLSARPEYLTGTPSERRAELLASDLSELDRTIILHTSEFDRVCAHAVTVIRTSRRLPPMALLDALSILPADNLIGVYYALPADNREACLRNQVWSYYVSRAPEGIERSLSEIAQLDAGIQEDVVKLAKLTEAAPKAAKGMTRHHERTAMAMAERWPLDD